METLGFSQGCPVVLISEELDIPVKTLSPLYHFQSNTIEWKNAIQVTTNKYITRPLGIDLSLQPQPLHKPVTLDVVKLWETLFRPLWYANSHFPVCNNGYVTHPPKFLFRPLWYVNGHYSVCNNTGYVKHPPNLFYSDLCGMRTGTFEFVTI
jgi:hypothetical protein